MLTIGSLFSGVGGLELGLEWAGLGPVVWQVEINDFCRGVLARHWPHADRSVFDVAKAGRANLAPVDVIAGGFPCQDISVAGKGEGLDGARSGLWREFSRIVGELRPRFVVIENVAALVARGLDRVVADLDGHGYRSVGRLLRASDVGAPHRRERLFVVAYRPSAGLEGSGVRRRPARDGAEVADADGEHLGKRSSRTRSRTERGGRAESRRVGSTLADGDRVRREVQRVAQPGGVEGARGGLADRRGTLRKLEHAARLENADRRGREESRESESVRSGASRAVARGAGRRVADAERDALRQLEQRQSARLADGVRDEGQTEPRNDGAAVGRAPEPGMGRGADGLPARVDRWPSRPGDAPAVWEPARTVDAYSPTWAARLAALGNSVVPQCGEVAGWAIRDIAGGAR